MKAKPTYYSGQFFRSKLEARWAYFFNLVGVKYTYEPKKFYLKDIKKAYIPDFYLKDLDIYLEVKGDLFTEYFDITNPLAFEKINSFRKLHPIVTFIGSLGEQESFALSGMFNSAHHDSIGVKFNQCFECFAVSLSYFNFCYNCGRFNSLCESISISSSLSVAHNFKF